MWAGGAGLWCKKAAVKPFKNCTSQILRDESLPATKMKKTRWKGNWVLGTELIKATPRCDSAAAAKKWEQQGITEKMCLWCWIQETAAVKQISYSCSSLNMRSKFDVKSRKVTMHFYDITWEHTNGNSEEDKVLASDHQASCVQTPKITGRAWAPRSVPQMGVESCNNTSSVKTY